MEVALTGGGDTYTYQKRYVHKDGRVVHVVLHNGVVRDDQGAAVMVVAQVEDLTERMKAEEEAREQRERLAHVDRLNVMGEMAASIAHEINQPAVGNCELHQRRTPPHRLRAARSPSGCPLLLIRIDEQAQRAGEVVRRLRNLVKKRDSERALLDVNDLVRDSVRLAEVDARIHDVSVDEALAEYLPLVSVDPVQIEQVILNLIRNAIDAMDGVAGKQSRLQICTRRDDDFVEVAVSDLGSGITPEDEARLFEPLLHYQGGGDGDGVVDQPLHRNRPRRALLVQSQPRARRDVPLHAAGGR